MDFCVGNMGIGRLSVHKIMHTTIMCLQYGREVIGDCVTFLCTACLCGPVQQIIITWNHRMAAFQLLIEEWCTLTIMVQFHVTYASFHCEIKLQTNKLQRMHLFIYVMWPWDDRERMKDGERGSADRKWWRERTEKEPNLLFESRIWIIVNCIGYQDKCSHVAEF